MIDKLILIHPTKCSGTTISKELLKLKRYSERKSNIYSGYSFNRFFQKNISFFNYIFHTQSIFKHFINLIFHIICFYFFIKNKLCNHTHGLTIDNGSFQHFTYKQWKKVKVIRKDSILIGVVTHPQHRMVSSYYFLGYNKHYTFLEFVQKIKDGSLLSLIPLIGLKSIVKQHFIPMYNHFINEKGTFILDVVLRREQLDNDWKDFCKSNKLDYQQLKRINKTKMVNNWKELYSKYPEAIDIVYGLYEMDFKYFGYTIVEK